MRGFYADDDEDDIDLFREALKTIDPAIVCSTARDGHEALDTLRAQTEKPDIIFLDFNMPRIDGMETVRELARIHDLKNIPVVIYSTHLNKEQIRTFRELGVSNFITKPNDFTTLHESLREVFKVYDERRGEV